MYSDRKIKKQRCEVGCQINPKGFGQQDGTGSTSLKAGQSPEIQRNGGN